MNIATSYNATGVILYSDPKDYAAEGVDKVYPDTWWLPPTGVQRGTVYYGEGDPLTPGYPATGKWSIYSLGKLFHMIHLQQTPYHWSKANVLKCYKGDVP